MLRVSIILVAFYCYPQSHVGVASERYSGFNGTAINPTSFINSPIDQEINVFGIDFQFDSDYGFIKNSSYLDLGDVFSKIKITNPFTDDGIDDLSINMNNSDKPYSILTSLHSGNSTAHQSGCSTRTTSAASSPKRSPSSSSTM